MASPAPAEAPPLAAVVLVTGASGLVGRALRDAVEAEQAVNTEAGADAISAARWVWLSSADGDLCDAAATAAIFERHRPSHVIHLAARVGGLFANLVHERNRRRCRLLARARRRLTRDPRACAAQHDNLGFFTQNCAMCAAQRHGLRRSLRCVAYRLTRRGTQERQRAAAVPEARRAASQPHRASCQKPDRIFAQASRNWCPASPLASSRIRQPTRSTKP